LGIKSEKVVRIARGSHKNTNHAFEKEKNWFKKIVPTHYYNGPSSLTHMSKRLKLHGTPIRATI
jgi:hypothetical protein